MILNYVRQFASSAFAMVMSLFEYLKPWIIPTLVSLCSIITYHHISIEEDNFVKAHKLAEKHVYKYFPFWGATCTAFHVGDGFVMTAAHCIEENKEQHQYAGYMIGSYGIVEVVLIAKDADRDIALLYADVLTGPGLNPSNAIHSDLQLYTVGSPGVINKEMAVLPTRVQVFGFGNGITAHTIGDNLWPGMSGGPLIDELGNVYGVVSYTQSFITGSSIRSLGSYQVLLEEWMHRHRQPQYTIIEN